MLNRECVDRLKHEEERLALEKALQKAANRGSMEGGSRGRGRANLEAGGSFIDPLSQFYLPSPAPAPSSIEGAEADEEEGVRGLAGWGQCHSCKAPCKVGWPHCPACKCKLSLSPTEEAAGSSQIDPLLQFYLPSPLPALKMSAREASSSLNRSPAEEGGVIPALYLPLSALAVPLYLPYNIAEGNL